MNGCATELGQSIGNNGRKQRQSFENSKNSEWMRILFNGTQICDRAFGTVAVIEGCSLL